MFLKGPGDSASNFVSKLNKMLINVAWNLILVSLPLDNVQEINIWTGLNNRITSSFKKKNLVSKYQYGDLSFQKKQNIAKYWDISITCLSVIAWIKLPLLHIMIRFSIGFLLNKSWTILKSLLILTHLLLIIYRYWVTLSWT